MGALISEQHRDKVRGFIQMAELEGANIHCGGAVFPEGIPETHKEVQHRKVRILIVFFLGKDALFRDTIFRPLL